MKPPEHVVFIFVDGIGIGKKDSAINPFFNAALPQLKKLCGDELFHNKKSRYTSNFSDYFAVNATLGIPGFPQSGTGQTAIFTGVNGAKVFGRHFGPYPPSILRPIIQSENILKRLKDIGRSVVFANAFPKQFFEYTSSGTRRLTVSTYSCISSGIPLLTSQDLASNSAISPDFIRARWSELGHPEIVPTNSLEAGRHLQKIAIEHSFTLFEYWLTDHAGHRQNMKFATEVLERLDEFLTGFFEGFDPTNTLFIFVSDHGNLEDLSTKSHTRNRVPCIVAGIHKEILTQKIRKLTDIQPVLLSLYQY